MILLTATAFAASPELLAALPFSLDAAEPAAMLPWREPFTEGTLLVARVDPATLRPSQAPTPQWWLGDQPLRSLGADLERGCVVFLAEGAVDLATAPMHLGPAELTERVDRATAARRLTDAIAAGAKPFAPRDGLKAASRRLAHGGELLPLAEQQLAACSATAGKPAP